VAHFRKRSGGWSVELYRNGQREHATFRTKAEAVQWAHQREAELTGAKLPDHTLDDALNRYAREIAPKLGGARWAATKIANLRAYALARKPLASIAGADIAAWRDARLESVQPATVNRELNLLRSVLEAARRDWGWLRVNPMADVKRPKNPPSRKRRIPQREIEAVVAGLGYRGGEPVTASQRVALAFLFALETGMRGGEIVGLRREHVGELSVLLPKTKNGDSRRVPLSTRAREILALLDGDPVFGLNSAQKDALFRAGRKRAGVEDLHFHDSRAEAIYRLSKKLDVMELARMIGHRNIASLMWYYDATADELAAKLG
jgi:integrase